MLYSNSRDHFFDNALEFYVTETQMGNLITHQSDCINNYTERFSAFGRKAAFLKQWRSSAVQFDEDVKNARAQIFGTFQKLLAGNEGFYERVTIFPLMELSGSTITLVENEDTNGYTDMRQNSVQSMPQAVHNYRPSIAPPTPHSTPQKQLRSGHSNTINVNGKEFSGEKKRYYFIREQRIFYFQKLRKKAMIYTMKTIKLLIYLWYLYPLSVPYYEKLASSHPASYSTTAMFLRMAFLTLRISMKFVRDRFDPKVVMQRHQPFIKLSDQKMRGIIGIQMIVFFIIKHETQSFSHSSDPNRADAINQHPITVNIMYVVKLTGNKAEPLTNSAKIQPRAQMSTDEWLVNCDKTINKSKDKEWQMLVVH
ncbi:hypothetical protein DICVIV_09251 [Dictyocaulus viviparus]|uniref:Uncharacterized protein n=1 Tax=Dictyocaulus viviparus TaxID=29172 RepID=A0A0D8XLW6_DICVI|nr:hypothetical protein DICVIV_09251 [Dictyocaulus viviparus]